MYFIMDGVAKIVIKNADPSKPPTLFYAEKG